MHSATLFPDARLEDLHARLLAHYGPPPPRDLWDPLTQMIYSMLSSRTKTEVSHAVLRALQARFGTWDNLRDAPIPEIEDTIRPATFPERKAVQLKTALVSITERCGSLDLGFLVRYRTEKVRAWLEAFDGVGVKTSAAVVNFSTLRRRAMCVDSHHLRIAQRLGFVNKGATAREAEARIMEMAGTRQLVTRHAGRPSLSDQAPWPEVLQLRRPALPCVSSARDLPNRIICGHHRAKTWLT